MVLTHAVQPSLAVLILIISLSSESEAKSIMNREDINAQLRKFRQDNIISEFFETGKREFPARFSSYINYQKYSIGATLACLEASIILHDKMKKQQIRNFLDHRGSQSVICIFTNYWSECLYLCQNMISVIFPTVPMFSS